MAKNDESSKPFDSFRLNVPFQDSFLIPNSGADAASTIPGEPLIVMSSGDNENLPVEANNMFRSNMIMSRNGGLIMYTSTDQTSALGDISVWDDSSRDLWNHTKAAEKFKIRTKDFDFSGTLNSKQGIVSGPSVRKKVYKIYVTFKCGQYMSGVKVNYATNGSNSFTGTFADTTYYTDTKGFDSYNAGTSTSQWTKVSVSGNAQQYLNDQEIQEGQVWQTSDSIAKATFTRNKTTQYRSTTITFISRSTGAYKHLTIEMNIGP